MTETYTEDQLDGLRELANVGSGQASTALSQMIGHAVDVSVPLARALPLAEAIDGLGDPEELVTGVAVPVLGGLDGVVLILLKDADAATLTGLLGIDPSDAEFRASALQEIGNILGACYLGVFGIMSGIELEPAPPEVAVDMLAAVVETVLAPHCAGSDTALLLDSELTIEGVECDFDLLLVPDATGIDRVLTGMGLAA